MKRRRAAWQFDLALELLMRKISPMFVGHYILDENV